MSPIKGLPIALASPSTPFQCRVSTGDDPGVKFDLAKDPTLQEAQSKYVAEVAAALARQVGGGACLGIYDTTGEMKEKTLLGIMDTLKAAGVEYRIEQSLKDRFDGNKKIQEADGFLPEALSPSLGRGPGT